VILTEYCEFPYLCGNTAGLYYTEYGSKLFHVTEKEQFTYVLLEQTRLNLTTKTIAAASMETRIYIVTTGG
jgi:hypothetical protein